MNNDLIIFRRAKRKGRNPSTEAKMRRAKRDGRNPSTGATLIDRFINRRAKRNGRNPATGA
jgi:nucleoid DNA-binding protein